MRNGQVLVSLEFIYRFSLFSLNLLKIDKIWVKLLRVLHVLDLFINTNDQFKLASQ